MYVYICSYVIPELQASVYDARSSQSLTSVPNRRTGSDSAVCEAPSNPFVIAYWPGRAALAFRSAPSVAEAPKILFTPNI